MAFAQEPVDGAADLLKGVTLCRAPHHPLTDGLTVLGGNLFGKVYAKRDPVTESVVIVADVIASPRAQNLAITAADSLVGKIQLTMSYAEQGVNRPLVCALMVTPVQK